MIRESESEGELQEVEVTATSLTEAKIDCLVGEDERPL